MDIWDKLLENEALRKKWDEKLINKFGHKPEDQVKKVRKPKTAAEKVELETDLEKITDWFWDKRNTSSFKILFPDVADRALLYRLIKNDDRGIKWFAKLMAKNGYRKQAEKPFEKKVVLIKKEKPEAAWSFDDAVKTLKPAIKRVQKAYEDADQRIGVGINWTMEELFGTGWERI